MCDSSDAEGWFFLHSIVFVRLWKHSHLASGTDLLDKVPCWKALCPDWHFCYKHFLHLWWTLTWLFTPIQCGTLIFPHLSLSVSFSLMDRHHCPSLIITNDLALQILKAVLSLGGLRLQMEPKFKSVLFLQQENVPLSLVRKCICFGKIFLIFFSFVRDRNVMGIKMWVIHNVQLGIVKRRKSSNRSQC